MLYSLLCLLLVIWSGVHSVQSVRMCPSRCRRWRRRGAMGVEGSETEILVPVYAAPEWRHPGNHLSNPVYAAPEWRHLGNPFSDSPVRSPAKGVWHGGLGVCAREIGSHRLTFCQCLGSVLLPRLVRNSLYALCGG